MPRAMPVISISRPRNTNSGTDEQDEVRHALVHAADDRRSSACAWSSAR